MSSVAERTSTAYVVQSVIKGEWQDVGSPSPELRVPKILARAWLRNHRAPVRLVRLDTVTTEVPLDIEITLDKEDDDA